MLILSHCSFAYGKQVIFRDLSLQLSEEQPLALMAPSGRGKTTLFKLMAGLLSPSSGTVSGIPAEGVAFAFQDDRLLPWLTVKENLLLPSPTLSGTEAEQILSELGLDGIAERFPEQLSGGMARRVSLARALLFQSPLVLLDEPFRGLDEQSIQLTASCISRRCAGKMLAVSLHQTFHAELLQLSIINPFEDR